jgi:hypothetical protein
VKAKENVTVVQTGVAKVLGQLDVVARLLAPGAKAPAT